jgi:phosphoglycolate phosphatase-like HAD superfamily hydrolase/tRNA(Arg) A34 adenosine deaminase TadA
MALDAILFDVDGTLIDTNGAHVEAWDFTLREHDYRVARDRIAVEIGKGGDQFIPSILGQEAYQRDGEQLAADHTKHYTKIAESRTLPAFPGVGELLPELRRRGLRTILATSSKMKELETAQKSAGLDLTTLVDDVVTADDAEKSKPFPDLVHAGVKKPGVSPAQCMMLGDTPYDADSCRGGGVVMMGVTCGGLNDEKTLRAAGARAVWRDPADLLAHLDDALQVASPGPAHLTWDVLHRLMRQALDTAREGLSAGEAPIGCVLARGDGSILARGYNELNRTQSKVAHAEMVTFNRSAGKVPTDARDLVLVCTLEPCVMCLGASMEAAVDTIVYGLRAPADGGTSRVRPPQSPESQMPRLIGDVLSNESRALFREFLNRNPNPEQAAFARQLLSLTK